MVEKAAKWIDLLAAVFLMFLFPAVSIHVKMRDRLFDVCVERIEAYGEMVQKQGFLSADVLDRLLRQRDEMLGSVDVMLWEERTSGERIMLTASYLEEHSCDYMGAAVYPFSDGEGIVLVIRMPADGFERAYYSFCGEPVVREYTCFFVIRDGLCERQEPQTEERREAIPLFDSFCDFVLWNHGDECCKGTGGDEEGAGKAEDGPECGCGGGRSSRVFGDLQ